jgi:type II secretory pathway component GspD/PulD (secretin)/beta-lactamase regulating signal transducer with metallopeptidase domain
MLILQDILSQEIVQRLGWSLLHFIWQAAAVALILTILLRVLRKSTANLRYIIACLALALIVLLPVITLRLVPVSLPLTAAHFAPALAPTVLPMEEMPAPETIVIAKPYQPESVTVAPAIPLKQRAVDTFEPALPYIVSGWLIGVFGLSIWHLGGWTQLQRLKRRMVKQVDSTLLKNLKVLTQKLKVKQTVQLMESALIQIPTVVGWLRPVILLPASALTGLSSEQLEAIIAHELAHIKRFDYLINILQTVVEILGFYHPAVWWVSHKIRAERENCCDDIAVSISGDRLSYAGALASMEEIRVDGGKLAVAATGGNLFRRICRLLGKDSTDNTGLSWVPAATAILLIIALAIPTTLALTNKSDSTLTEIKTEVPVEDDILIETSQDEESPIENIPPVPVLAKSPTPPKDKAHVRINFFVVEVYHDSKIDTEALAGAEKLLGNKISPRERKIDVIMRAATEAMIASKDESNEKNRLTQDQYKAFIEMLASKGYIKILMNPTIETLNGKTATIRSAQHVPLQQKTKASPEIEYVDVVDLIEITPSVLEDGNIILDIEADLGSRNIPVSKEQTITVSSRQLSSKVCVSPGESVIIGGFVENHPAHRENINNNEKQAKELLLIITPTIITPPNNSPPPAHILIEIEKVQLADKLKRLGVAVAMYADDHDDNLPESIQELKPYLLDERDFDWFRDNVEYFDKGKTTQRNATYIPIAYDKTLLEKADGTNVLFLDFSVRFRQRSDFDQLDMKRAKFLIEARFLLVGEDFLKNINLDVDTWDIAQSNLTPEKLKSLGFSKTGSLILNDLDVNLLLSAVKNQKDSKMLAHPQILTREGTTDEISTMSKETDYIVDYTEPNSPSEKPQPKIQRVKEGISLSLKSKLTEKKYIDTQFEFKINQVASFKEKMYKGKYPCKIPTIQRTTQTTRYTAKDGQTLLFGGHKIADKWGGQSEQKDLLVLITAHTIYSSEQDKSAQVKNLEVAEPKIIQTRTERPKDDKQEKAKPATERRRRPARSTDDSLAKIDNEKKVTQIFSLKHHDTSQIARILSPLISKTGHVSKDERTNSLIVSDTAENLTRIEKIIAQYDIPKPNVAVTEIFEIRNGDPVEIVEILKKLINGRHDTTSVIKPDTASVIESSNGPILLIPEPKRKWIIAKASTENINQIGQWIKKLDTDKSTIGLDPIAKAVHEQLEMIVDLSDLTPGMSFGEVVEILENSVEPPLQIQPIWKDLLDNAEVEETTPAGMDPLPHIKLRKALEILLTSVSSTGLPKLTYIVDEGVILIGTADVLPPKMAQSVYKPFVLVKTTADANQTSLREQDKTTPAIKQHEIVILRQQYINNDLMIKYVSERITKKENELIELRQQYTPSHPEIRKKASLLRALKNALQKRKKEVGKAFDDIMTKEIYQANQEKITTLLDELRKTKEHQQQPSQVQENIDKLLDESEEPMTPLEQIQKQLDELIKHQEALKVAEPNLPPAPKVKLISNTFIDCPLLDALQSIATEANATIIPDETVKGFISCTLKDVTVETALDIILAGTPYVWKKTPHYYLVTSGNLMFQQMSETHRMTMNYVTAKAAIGLLSSAFKPYVQAEISEPRTVGEPITDTYTVVVTAPPDLAERIIEDLKKIDIGDAKILIDSKLLLVNEDFLKDVGLDPNSIYTSGPWSQHLAAKYPAEPNSEIYSLILDDLHVSFLLRALGAHKDAHIIASPQVLCQEGKMAEIVIMTEEHYFTDYNEPNNPSNEPEQKLNKVEIGTYLWLKPILTPDNKKVDLNLKFENTRLKGIIDSKYKGEYSYKKPIVDVISLKMPCIIPDGKTILIGGMKMNKQIKKEPGVPRLKDLPLIGAAFRSKDKIKEQKMLLILVKPIINPQQKATKIRPGQESSEAHIKRLAEQLDKKINPLNKPK